MEQENLAGRTFGYWTVKDEYFITENNIRKWLCACRCGTERYVNERNLLYGKSRSCGCLSSEHKRIQDMTGLVFSKLTVLERVPSRREGRATWLCQCECGNLHVVVGKDLRDGKVQSCGCLKKEHTRAVDMSGRTFGRLTAIAPTDKRDRKGSVIWKCVCSCGTEVEVSQDDLAFGNKVSCGCRKEEIKKNIHKTLHHVDGTCIEFLQRKQRSDNTTGYTGVFHQRNGMYRAYIGFKKHRYNLGAYDKLEDAVRVRKIAEDVLHKGFVEEYYAQATGSSKKQLLPVIEPEETKIHALLSAVEAGISAKPILHR